MHEKLYRNINAVGTDVIQKIHWAYMARVYFLEENQNISLISMVQEAIPNNEQERTLECTYFVMVL